MSSKCGYCIILIALIGIVLQLYLQYGDLRKYNRNTTAEEVATNIDLTGKIIIITGANSGIGKQTVRTLVSHGATVILACRNIDKAQKAKDDLIKQLTDNNFKNYSKEQLSNNMHISQLDLADLQSIMKFARAFETKYNKLNYLILNAGIFGIPEWKATKDGIETVFGVNYIGHFYLTKLLTPLLIKSSSIDSISRVISVAGDAFKLAPDPLEPWLMNDRLLQNPNEYGMWQTYGFSKASNILFIIQYNKRYSNKNVHAVSLHPGTIATQIDQNLPKWLAYIWRATFYFFMKTEEAGAATTVRAVTMSDEEFKRQGGGYFVDCNIANDQLRYDLKNESLQVLLWQLSEQIIKDKTMSIDNMI